MNDYNVVIPDTIFVNDFTIIYKGKEEKEGQIFEPIVEIKTSKDEFFRKLRYFKRRTPEMNTINEIYIHDEYSPELFKKLIESIKTKSIALNENNINIFHQLSLKYEYYELQGKIEDFLKNRPDIQLIINKIALENKKNKSENQENEKNEKKIFKEIDPIKEEIIAKHLDICLQNDNLMQLPISSLHRIFSSPKKVLKNHHLLYQFVKKMVDKYESNQTGSQDQQKIKSDLQLLIGSLDYDKMTEEEIESLLNKNYLNSVFTPPAVEDKKSQLQLKAIEERIQKIESTFSEKIQILEKSKDEKEKKIKEMSAKLLKQEEIIKNYESKIQRGDQISSESALKETDQKSVKPNENSHQSKQTDPSQNRQTQQQQQSSPAKQSKPNEPSQNQQTQQQPKQTESVQNHPSQQQQAKPAETVQTRSSTVHQPQPTTNQTESSQNRQPQPTMNQTESSQNRTTQSSQQADSPAKEKVKSPSSKSRKQSAAKSKPKPPKLLVKDGEMMDVSSSSEDSSSTVSSSSSIPMSALSASPHAHQQKEPQQPRNEKLVLSKEYRRDQFQGIFGELTKANKGNICDKGVISVTGNRDEDYGTFASLVNFGYNGVNYTSEPDPNSFICFDFKAFKVAVSAYTIKSSNQRNPNYLVSWVLEGSDDKNEWINIDSHSNERALCSKSKSCTFSVQEKDKAEQRFRFIQIRMTGKSPRNNFVFSITNVELFGKYYSSS